MDNIDKEKLEEQRILAYNKLREQKAQLDKLGFQYAKARAAYQASYEEYTKLDVQLATYNRKIITGGKEGTVHKKEKNIKEELRELAKEVGMQELLNIIKEA
jgi:hypothetical protein